MVYLTPPDNARKEGREEPHMNAAIKAYPMKSPATFQGTEGTATTHVPFVFPEDGWFNMTKAAQAFGKNLRSFICMDDTRDYIAALQANSVSGTEYL